ncbi:MAG: hypothetical protein PHU01_01025 [Desulfuromonadaceae bacterium]|nr:hypothetical protein [Desulfuromonadaceae bacterium]
MRLVKNENGVALITALLFMMLSLGIVMTLLYMVTQSTKITSANRSYKTALEASYGATELLSKDILPTIFATYTSGSALTLLAAKYATVNMGIPDTPCVVQKTSFSTANWDATICLPDTKTTLATEKPDITFNLKATNDSSGYNVYAKIIDTKCGGDTSTGQPCSNSKLQPAGSEDLSDGSGVSGGAGTVKPQSTPAYYRIDVQGQRAANPREKTELSVLYAY